MEMNFAQFSDRMSGQAETRQDTAMELGSRIANLSARSLSTNYSENPFKSGSGLERRDLANVAQSQRVRRSSLIQEGTTPQIKDRTKRNSFLQDGKLIFNFGSNGIQPQLQPEPALDAYEIFKAVFGAEGCVVNEEEKASIIKQLEQSQNGQGFKLGLEAGSSSSDKKMDVVELKTADPATNAMIDMDVGAVCIQGSRPAMEDCYRLFMWAKQPRNEESDSEASLALNSGDSINVNLHDEIQKHNDANKDSTLKQTALCGSTSNLSGFALEGSDNSSSSIHEDAINGIKRSMEQSDIEKKRIRMSLPDDAPQRSSSSLSLSSTTNLGMVRVNSFPTKRKRKNSRGGFDDSFAFFAVYDGHGGMECAEYVNARLHESIINHPQFPENAEAAIRDTFLQTDTEFAQYSKTCNIPGTIGTTVTTAIIIGNYLYVGNVGDTEAMLCTNGRPKTVTCSHKPANNFEEERITAAGGRIVEIANQKRLGHSRLNPKFFHIGITRAIGDLDFKSEDLTGGKSSGLIAEPSVSKTLLTADDQFLMIASDGFWDVVSQDEASQYVLKNAEKDSDSICKNLIELSQERKTRDNVTVLLVKFKNLTPTDPSS
eukprot:TRINITY_DN15526_c0_g1_i1.p1 TRINITY_DN15526_c0_g1~~TRINITY_DN15526_c0_g1_i1.p1  ORF type:complete len:600 (-),score=127.41 TRINITY_DN15526_c0_g1_i1:109-1908(-)